jgi:pimeloyl-ACP methyl ester carboxylesterase
LKSPSSGGTAYALAGPHDAPVVVLIHGLGLSRRMWDPLRAMLAQSYRVLTYDLCGHGESSLPTHAPNLTVLSDQLRALLDLLGIQRCAIIGFSLGGMVNRRFAIDHPSRVAALGILNSPHERSPDAQRLVEERAAQTSACGPAATINSTLERWFTPEFRARQPDAVELVRDLVLSNDAKNFALHRQVLASGVIELIRPIRPIMAPTLVMTCEHDTGSTPAMSHAIASEIASSQTVVVPKLQHLGILEQPELFSVSILRFLSNVPPASWALTKENKL